MANSKYQIVDYKESWPGEFSKIASEIRAGLGELALRIDHIGSTAVPGLPAKDVIDIQITVASLGQDVINAMATIGYSLSEGIMGDHVPPGQNEEQSHWQKLYFHPPPGQRRTHIHVRQPGSANQRYPLLFRDYLRVHPNTAEAYARLKRMLSEHLADPYMYPEVKDPAVDLIYLAAEEWASLVNWQPGPSDN
ncbi:MAG TPA: GrpB family protein [Anaerolineaceae bacterium]|nr:GrpB family protein [Anaerolineaceae bacterium]